jgi:hypothetical protein
MYTFLCVYIFVHMESSQFVCYVDGEEPMCVIDTLSW